ncbi:type II toxin-antitoxin system VapC family toxin [Cryobacterium melibiosiphilum]|uniref:Type II toxin-antitoxin system VapC family toxin n=1 Tax=Cryobacterium melibiosiphilum TaxID=995039 RepID=A0A3A5MXR8_9MICO|nr:type II toxin-antitoxin system VapC family toxin [Cryobacterium melibiosiphilum]RJT92133.1 type II toxin-antitoxin system VapC family toxin [Cryobacterium melibiosiphilum]
MTKSTPCSTAIALIGTRWPITLILLDTNALLWLLGDPKQFGPDALHMLAENAEVYSSPVSVFEISIKTMLGKLSVPADFAAVARVNGIKELPLNHVHAEAVGEFPELTRHDPFDRLILAQAFVESMTLLTADRVLISLGRPFVRDARA